MNTPTHNVLSAHWVLVTLVASLSVGLAGCEFLGLDSGANTAGQTTQQANKGGNGGEQSAAQPEVEQEQEAEYVRPDYPEKIRRNPFLPDLEIMQPKEQIAEGDIRPLEPLEKYALGELELVSIISEVAVPKAMFIDPKGFGHVVKEGDRIGQNGGSIADIRDNEVEVREITDEEETQTRLTTVKLRSEELQVREKEGLSDEEREALQRLLQSDEGKKVLQDLAPEAAASDGQQQGGGQRGRRFGPPQR